MDTRFIAGPDASPLSSRRREHYPGWWVVGACFVIAAFGWGLGFYGPGVYMVELQARHGWPVSLIATATTLYYLSGAALIVMVPDIMQRLDQRATILGGAAAMTIGVGLLPVITAPWQLLAAYVLMSAGWATLSATAITTILAPWFVRRRGFAISLAFNGASASGVVVVPALVLLIAKLGFAGGIAVVIAALLLLLVPVVVVSLRWPSPEAAGWAPDGDSLLTRHRDVTAAAPSAPRRSELLVSGAFWGVAVPFALALLAQVAFLTHQISFLAPYLGREGAGLAVSLTTAAAVSGRLLLGLVVDRLDRRRVTALTFASQAVALIAMALWPADPVVLYSACLVFGFSVGNVVTLSPLIVQGEFPVTAFATVIALVTAVSQVTYAFGPGLIGIVRDLSGGYGAALALCAAIDFAAAWIIAHGWRGR
jgi:MFS family permease